MATLLCCMLSMTMVATAFVPGNDAQVLEEVPRRDDPQAKEVRALSDELKVAPDDAKVAVKVSQKFLAMARAEGDPRWVGRAQTALGKFWDSPAPPEPVLVMRAVIRQSVHDFPAALVDLDRAVVQVPQDPQAWLTRASVQQVRGEFGAARVSCGPVVKLARPLVSAACLASVGSLSGSLATSRALLAHVLFEDDGAEPAVTGWALTLLAEMSARQGDARAADAYYRKALSLGPPDAYLLASYSDFLLDQRRPAEVLPLLQQRTRADALLLRLALAEKELHDPALAAHVATLGDRFDASHARGDTVHRREEAIFRLKLLGDAKGALQLAQANWEVQREPLDARILVEAARAAKEPRAAQPVLAFVEKNHLEDATLSAEARP